MPPLDLGATMVEYGLILLLVVIGALGLVAALGGSVLDIFTELADLL